jgi:N-acetylglucosaminyldiphosphoundecaprenol N-acetyl-beta-D-mannosaminyltransferase
LAVTRYNVLGVPLSALNLARATELILSARGPSRRGYVCVTGVHGVIESQDDPAIMQAHREAWLVTPDGMPMVWLGPSGTERVYGPDLMLSVCDAGRATGLTHYFFGGSDGVAGELRENLTRRFPGLNVVGTHTPPFRPLTSHELAEWRAEIERLKPDEIWVGLSTPKQERFMAEVWPELHCGAMVGVGAAFDFHAGRMPQAPRWIQRSGFEWLYRLTKEPRRLAPRYLRNNPRFLWLLLLQKLRLRRF